VFYLNLWYLSYIALFVYIVCTSALFFIIQPSPLATRFLVNDLLAY